MICKNCAAKKFIINDMGESVCLYCGCTNTEEQNIETKNDFNFVMEYLVRILIDDKPCGTGFFVNQDTIVTCAHIIDLAKEQDYKQLGTIKAELYSEEVLDARLAAYDTDCDVAVLKLLDGDNKREGLEFCEKHEMGDKVFCIGDARGWGLGLRQGIISKTNETGWNKYTLIRTDINICEGESGSPLLNNKMKVVGMMACRPVINGRLTTIGGISFAIESRNIIKMLKADNYKNGR